MQISEENKCPVCEQAYTGFNHVHITTKFDESDFGLFVKGHPKYWDHVERLSSWAQRVLGPSANLCIRETDEGFVVLDALTYIKSFPKPRKYTWERPFQSPVMLHILTHEEVYYTMLLDPWLTS